MARTLEQIQNEFDAVSEATRKAYDKLHRKSSSPGTGENLLQKYEIAVRDNNEYYIKRYKEEYESAQSEYKAAQEKKNALRKELNAAKKTEEKEKLSAAKEKSAGNVYAKALNVLKNAELGINGYKGAEKYQDAFRKAEAAYNTAIQAGLTPAPLGTPKIEVPPVAVETKGETGGTTPAKAENLSDFISVLADPANSALVKQVQEDLKNNFKYKGPVDGKYSLPLQNAINTIATSRSSLPVNLQGTDFRSFLADANSSALLGITATGADGGSGGTSITNYISDATQAAATVNKVVQSVLGREATTKEIKDLSAILIDAQKKNPYKTTNGIRTGGIDDMQLLTDVIKTGEYLADKKLGKLSTLGKLAAEATTRKAESQDLEKEKILATARANGFQLSDVQVNNYLNDLKNGQTMDTINKRIRTVAAMGMPDAVKQLVAEGTDLETIYQPYKNRMAAILEINPETIDLNDPTLRGAIGPDKEMSIYDFEKQLRKDSRWQYTNNARETVSDAALRVLKDFGFQG